MTPVHKGKNLGKMTALWCKEIGIESLEEIKSLGAVAVYTSLKAIRPTQVSLVCLWALEGAVTDTHWLKISKKRKAELKRQL